MPRQDTVDFLTAFAVGTALGIGTTLLLRPERTPKQRLVRQLKPYRKQMRKSYQQARSAVQDGGRATAGLTDEAVEAGRELLGEFRAEVAEILGEARNEMRSMVQGQVKDLTRGVKRTRRKMGM